MVDEGIRGGVCHAIHRYAKANSKYMKDYNKDEEVSLYGFPMIQKLPVEDFK